MRKPIVDEVASAKAAGLRYVIPKGQGITRLRRGKAFSYRDAGNRSVKDKVTLSRIKALVIPPAWESVWISPASNAHIQAVGRDARGRKQYRYHAEYRKARDLVKFDRMLEFGRALPEIRRAVNRDLKRKGMPKEKILAAIVRLLETSHIRIGNEEYAQENGSFGLTTLRNRHLEILGKTLKFHFRGKSGQNHEIRVSDKRLAPIIKKCRDLPGQLVFQYVDEEGGIQAIESGDVNEYIGGITGSSFTAKDFRTWCGSCLAAGFLVKGCSDTADKMTKTAMVAVIKDVAAQLGNTPATCKKYYIHPAVFDCYLSGRLKKVAIELKCGTSDDGYERLVLSLLKALA